MIASEIDIISPLDFFLASKGFCIELDLNCSESAKHEWVLIHVAPIELDSAVSSTVIICRSKVLTAGAT